MQPQNFNYMEIVCSVIFKLDGRPQKFNCLRKGPIFKNFVPQNIFPMYGSYLDNAMV